VGFEPTGALSGASGFQDRSIRPLWHPAVLAVVVAATYSLPVDPERERDREAFASEPDDLWSGHDHGGWNRASIRFWSRSDHGPALRPEDLLLPSGLGNLRMLARCAGMGFIMTLLYVWFPLMLVSFFAPIGETAYISVLAGAVTALTLALYAFGTIETHRDRELAGRL
jgi:TM2 domain-containing membrane protein YozV